MRWDIDEDSGRPFIKINHPAPGDVVRNPAHVAGYGTAFEGTISLRIRDDDGTVIAEGSTQGGSNGVIGEFKADLEFDRRPNQRLGVVEAFEESASGGSLYSDEGFSTVDRIVEYERRIGDVGPPSHAAQLPNATLARDHARRE